MIPLDATLLLIIPIIWFSYRIGRAVERRLWLNSIPVLNKVKTKKHKYEHSQN
jgi:hypothetical protein